MINSINNRNSINSYNNEKTSNNNNEIREKQTKNEDTYSDSKIDSIKKQIESGLYKVDLNKLSEKIAEDLLN